jgi:hypothetical protein
MKPVDCHFFHPFEWLQMVKNYPHIYDYASESAVHGIVYYLSTLFHGLFGCFMKSSGTG